MAEPRLHWPTATLVAVVVAVAANVVSYPSVETATSAWYDAVWVKPADELRGLTAAHFGSTRDRFEAYVQLRDLAPGATLVQPPDGRRLTREQVRGLARMAHVLRPYDPAVPADVATAMDADADAVGEDELLGAYTIVVADGPVEEVVLLRGPQRTYLVDRRVADGLGVGAGS